MTQSISPYWRALVPALVFTGALAAVFAFYGFDVFERSRGLTDWVMIAPLSLIGIFALALSAFQEIRAAKQACSQPQTSPDADAKPQPTAPSHEPYMKPLAFMAGLGVYVATLPWLGFDLGTILFVCASLLLQGERRWWVHLGVGVGASLLLCFLFRSILLVRMPTLFM